MFFPRKKYLDLLIESQGNGLVKIITGGRRCGKSFLLFNIFHNYLLNNNVPADHITEIQLDDIRNRKYRNPELLFSYIESCIHDDGERHYVILDEIQLVEDFVEVLLGLMHLPSVDVYVSGSNSKFLSKDVVTEFRGRGDEIRVWPLSFKEYYDVVGGDRTAAWNLYYNYGGLPQVAGFKSLQKKEEYLSSIFELTYINDIIERNALRNADGLRQLVQVLASAIGSPTNAKRISNTFKSKEGLTIIDKTIKEYISYLQDAFLIEEALRYDVKGRKYIGTETKYYFCDMGLRAVPLNFRQQEENHIMENAIYNELRQRGYLVDVGMVEAWKQNAEGRSERRKYEVDFVVNRGYRRYYIQSAFAMHDEEKKAQEEASLKNIGDAFKRIIVVRDDIMPYYNDNGFLIMGLFDFLLNPKSLEI